MLNKIIDKIYEKISTELENQEISIEDVTKNNDTTKTALKISEKTDSDNPVKTAALIYIDDYAKSIKEGDCSLDDATNNIIRSYKNSLVTEIDDLVTNIADFNSISDKIVYRLVNYEKNENMLQDMPYDRFLDLAITYRINYTAGNTNCSINITNQALERWGVSKDIIRKLADRNTEKYLQFKIFDLHKFLSDIYMDINEEIDMYVATNKENCNGASVLLYTMDEHNEIWNLAKEMDTDLYIIPSSIHEVILVPIKDSLNKDDIVQMIKEVNTTVLDETDYLSDSLYLLEKDTGTIKIA